MSSGTLQGPTPDSSRSAADAVQAAVRFLRVLRNRKSYLVTATVVACCLGALYYFTATRLYQASASLLFTPTGADVWNTGMTPDASRENLIPTYEQLFTSAVVLEGAIERLQPLPEQMRVDFLSQPREKWTELLKENLSTSIVRRTNLIQLDYRSRDPEAAEAVVGALVQSYLNFVDQNHRDVSKEVASILQEKLAEIEDQLAQKQDQLLELKRAAGDLGIRENNGVVHPLIQRVILLNNTLVEVQKQRAELEATLSALQSAIAHNGDLREHLLAIEPMVGRQLMMNGLGLDPEFANVMSTIERKIIDDQARLESLAAHLGPNHPQVVEIRQAIHNSQLYLQEYQTRIQQRLRSVGDRDLGPMLVAMCEEKLAKLQAQETTLRRAYAEVESDAIARNDRMAQLTMAEGELERLQNLYRTLLDRIANININHDRADVRVAVVSEPKALEDPVSPKLPVVGLLCLLVGMGGGTLLVYILDLMDDRFRSPEELQEQLGIPVLTMIRKLPSKMGQGLEALTAYTDFDSLECEAFRTLRTTLGLSGKDVNRLSITSSEPGDGKTTVLANLAVTFAQAGKRTLLIDADLRLPGLSKLFGMRRLSGLSDLLRSDAEISSQCQTLVQSTRLPGLDILPCGPKPPDPAEHLAGSRMADLLAWAETHYDQILVDCPPVLAASDAAIVGRLTDGVLLVVQPSKNHRRLVVRASESLAAMGIKVLGIVANRVEPRKSSDYYGYGYAYGHGYGSSEKDEPEQSDATEAAAERTDSVSPLVRRRAA